MKFLNFVIIALIIGLSLITPALAELETLNRTADSISYLNTTSNETFIILYPRFINMLNDSGVYSPFTEVTSLTENNYNMVLSWYNKSITFKFYTKNESGYKEYLENKTQQELDQINMTTTIESDTGIYHYVHNMTQNISNQPFQIGYDLILDNVSCVLNSTYVLSCGEQFISFKEAALVQNITLLVNESFVEFNRTSPPNNGTGLSFIDPQIILGGLESYMHGVWYESDTGLYDGDDQTGGTNQERVGSDCFSSCTEHDNHRSFIGYSTTSLSTDWDIDRIELKWYDNYEADPDSDTIRFIQMFESDFLDDDVTPGSHEESRVAYNNIEGSENIYATDASPDENSYNLQVLGSPAEIRLESDINNRTRFFIGFQNPSGGDRDNYIDIYDDSSNFPPQLIITYSIDQTPPVTTISATSPPGIANYSFLLWTNQDIRVRLSCADGGRGCESTKYCIDDTGSCTPSITYTGSILHTSEGNKRIRFRSTDKRGNSGSVRNENLKIDKTDPATIFSGNSQGQSYIFGQVANDDVNISLSCSDSHSGCVTVKYCLDNNNTCIPTTEYSSSFIISTNGTTYLRAYSSDYANNIEDVKSKTVIINREFPQNVILDVNGTEAFESTGIFQGTEKVDLTFELNGFLDNCTADEDGYCIVPINIHSDTAGIINVTNLNINMNVTSYIWDVTGFPELSTYRTRIASYDGLFNSSWDASDNDFTIGNSILSIPYLNLIYSNGMERVFGFAINNSHNATLNNISWTFNTGQSNISSQYVLTLGNGEDILVYPYYNYTSSGNYTVTATAVSGQYLARRSINLQV